MALAMRKPVWMTVPLLLLLVLGPLQVAGRAGAQDAPNAPKDPGAKKAPTPSAAELLERAIKAQGKLSRDSINDLHVKFVGQIREKGQATQSATREYWFRAKDRSFRIRTVAGAQPNKPHSERGVLGSPKIRYWEWAHKRRTELYRTNREHRKNILAIRRDRDDFERIVKTVLLARLRDPQTQIAFAAQRLVKLEADKPNSARHIFPDRSVRYHVLDIRRPDADPLRLFIHEGDFTVRKVVQFDRTAPQEVKSISYFGYFRKAANAGGMLLPQAFSVYSAVPDGKKQNKETVRVAGQLTVEVNRGLDDPVFSPGK
jgi:hypothetical protein